MSLALGSCLLAGFSRFWLAPNLERLPADYASETRYAAAKCRGVDRRTRRNLSGYGNVDRDGQFLFPHLQRTTYRFWDPFYTGPRVAAFNRVATVNGMTVYVFDYTADHIDDTAGYSFLRDVPERYRAISDGRGTLWIEPVTGIVVDFEDAGKSYFVDPATQRPVADFYFWSARYTPETKAAQLRLAGATRRRDLALAVWLPVALLLGGLVTLAGGPGLPQLRRRPEERHGGAPTAESPGVPRVLTGAAR